MINFWLRKRTTGSLPWWTLLLPLRTTLPQTSVQVVLSIRLVFPVLKADPLRGSQIRQLQRTFTLGQVSGLSDSLKLEMFEREERNAWAT